MVPKRKATELEKIKGNIDRSYQYFKSNYDRFNKFTQFVLVDNLTNDERTRVEKLKKPPLTFNILEPFVSALCGEFMKHEPSIVVRPADSIDSDAMSPDFIKLMDLMSAHLREIIFNKTGDGFGYHIYRDLLIGGFSVAEVYTDYVNDYSLDQNIFLRRVDKPTMVGFDPTAMRPDKGDGEYCFKNYIYTRGEVEDKFGLEAARDMRFMKQADLEGYQWSYKNDKESYAMISDYYCKREKDMRIVLLSNGRVIEKSQYEPMLEKYQEMGVMTLPPVILDERKSKKTTIERYRVCETEVLDYEETNYSMLPLVFFDGNSAMTSHDSGDVYQQVTRPYLYNAVDAQRLKNFAGQTLAAEIENMMMHKLMAPIEGIPENTDYQQTYTNFQQASTVVYNAFKDGNPEIPLPSPQVIPRTQTPAIVTEAFFAAENMVQNILGNYDAQAGSKRQDISGRAFIEGKLNSGEAADPYLNGYVSGLNRCLEIMVDLFPKYYVTPRTIPILELDGERSYVQINNPQGGIKMDYNAHDLQVKVEAGASFGVQKRMAVEQIKELMNISPAINEFVSSGKGMNVLLDNMEFRGQEQFKESYKVFSQQKEQQSQQMQQMQQGAMQSEERRKDAMVATQARKVDGDIQAKAMSLMQNEEKIRADETIGVADVTIKKQEADTDYLKAIASVRQDEVTAALRAEETAAENARTAAELAMELEKHNSEMMRGE